MGAVMGIAKKKSFRDNCAPTRARKHLRRAVEKRQVSFSYCNSGSLPSYRPGAGSLAQVFHIRGSGHESFLGEVVVCARHAYHLVV